MHPAPSPGPAAPESALSEVCPGCGAVLAPVDDAGRAHPGASPSCTRLFEVTLRGPREEAASDGTAAATARLADAAYDAQHPDAADPERTASALQRLSGEPGATGGALRRDPPRVWTTTITDIAADLDVIDLSVLVTSWARAVRADWTVPA